MTGALSSTGAVSLWVEVILSVLFAVWLIVLAEFLARRARCRGKDGRPEKYRSRRNGLAQRASDTLLTRSEDRMAL